MSELNTSDLENIIRTYCQDIVHMSLGTCRDNKPWVCEVHYVLDDNLNIYFRSLTSRRHSQDIAANPNVAGNIVVQHPMGVKPRGVYFEGTAERLEGVTADSPEYAIFHERFGLGPEIVEDAAKSEGHQFYKISVHDFYLFDARESKPSQKYHLAWGVNRGTAAS